MTLRPLSYFIHFTSAGRNETFWAPGAAFSVDTCPYLRSSWNVSFFICNWISFGWADPCLPLTPSFRLLFEFLLAFDVGDRNRCPFTEGRNQSVDLGFHLCLSILPVGALNVMLVSEQWPGNNPASKIESFHTEPGKTERDSRPCLNLMPGLPRWMA